jgi:hypothetical protein
MTESSQPNPEVQNPINRDDPELGIVRSAFGRISEWRRNRAANSLAADIERYETAIGASQESQEVNRVTGEYTLITGPNLRTKFPGEVGEISEDHKGDYRPITGGERRVRRKTERAFMPNSRRAGVVYDLNTVYGRKDPNVEPVDLLDLPDRKPGVGNQEMRAKVDEALRRAGLLDDQAPQPTPELLKLGTPEHRAVVATERLRPAEQRSIRSATRKATQFDRRVTRKVDYVESVAVGTDRSAKRHEKKQAKLRRKIAKKQQKGLNRLSR